MQCKCNAQPNRTLHFKYEDGVLSKAPKARIKVGFKSDIWALGVILFQVQD